MDKNIEVINGIVLPSSIECREEGDNKTTFLIKPLSAGFGTTLGNTLRRVLLSYVEGYAINYIKIPGVKHEFSAIDGVREDVVDLVLNLKQVRFKKKGKAQSETIKVKINKEVFLAGDIDKFSSNFEIVNKNFEVCHFNSPQPFEIELNVISGEGWTQAKEIEPGKDEIGTIFIDSIFSPVKNVSFDVTDARVGQQIGYDALEISITTDGSLSPAQALNIVIEKLKNIFGFLLEPKIYTGGTKENLDDVDIKKIKIEKILNSKIEDFELSSRLKGCLASGSIIFIKDLVATDMESLGKLNNFGKKSMEELNKFLEDNGLSLGMDLKKYKV